MLCARAQATVPDMWMALVKALARLSTHPQEHIRAQALVILQRCVWPNSLKWHCRDALNLQHQSIPGKLFQTCQQDGVSANF